MAIKLVCASDSLPRETVQSHKLSLSVEREHDTMKPGTQFTQGGGTETINFSAELLLDCTSHLDATNTIT